MHSGDDDALRQEMEEAAVGLQIDAERRDRLEAAIEACTGKLLAHRRTEAMLKGIVTASSHRMMAPVCGGLAYFEGELVDTNRLLVLLGESIFAERSAAQAGEIMARRVKFLLEEEARLKDELEIVAGRLAIAGSAGFLDPFEDGKRRKRNGNTSTETGAFNEPAPRDKNLTVQFGDDEEEEEEEEEIDEADLLTLDEIEAVEEMLGEDVMDEEKAELALKAAVDRKKASRIARENAARAASQQSLSRPPEAPVPAKLMTPGDIGAVAEATLRLQTSAPSDRLSTPARNAAVEADSAPRGASLAAGQVVERAGTSTLAPRLAPIGGGRLATATTSDTAQPKRQSLFKQQQQHQEWQDD
jgi:prefoldin subunit 5